MNTISNLNKNLLFLPQTTQDTTDLLKHCMEFTKRGEVVLFLTCSFDLLPIIKSASLTIEEMKRLVIMEFDNIDGYIQKLSELHEWTWLPAIVVVDLRSVINKITDELHLINTVQLALQDHNSTEAAINVAPFFQQVVLLIATLLGYNESIFKRLQRREKVPRVSILNCVSVLILKEHSVHLTQDHIELLINLYYYSNNAFNVVREVLETLSLNC